MALVQRDIAEWPRRRPALRIRPSALVGTAAAAAIAMACAPRAPEAPPEPPSPERGALPPIPAREGPLALDLVYPPEDGAVAVSDSTFVFGSVGTGQARLSINGFPVQVEPNGAFLAFLPVPGDGTYRLEAESGGQTATLERTVSVPTGPEPPPERPRIMVETLHPTGPLVLGHGEPLTVSFRGVPGGRARLILPDGTVIPMVEAATAGEVSTGFMEEGRPAVRRTEYRATFPVRVPFRSADTAVAGPTLVDLPIEAGEAVVELVVGWDSVRAPLPATVGLLDPGAARVGEVGVEGLSGGLPGMAAAPPGTPYHWFFPTGTRLRLSGERPGVYRVQLTDDLYVWVPGGDVRLLEPERRDVRGSVGDVRVSSEPGYQEVRIATSDRFPFHVSAEEGALEVSIFGAESRTNWMYLPTDGSLIAAMDWEQPSSREYRLRVELAGPVWGWDTRWAPDGALLLRVRRPPAVDPAAPLRGVRVAVDAGHPPGGAIGPTRLTEAEANVDIARRLADALERAGASVVRISHDTVALGLYERVVAAAEADADLFVSVHNNAFPDGVNPYERAGTSVLYNRLHSLPLARHFQRELLAELGLRDIGIIYADRAVIRNNTWMPSALTESTFLMVPRQEAALRDPAVQERIARAHLRAIEAFLRESVGR